MQDAAVNPNAGYTLILFDRDDVLDAGRPQDVAGAVALSPSASTAAVEAGIRIPDSLSLFSDYGHARCVAAARRALLDFDRAAERCTLAPSVRLMARQSIWMHAALVHRLAQTLPAGPWLVRGDAGQWHDADDWQALCEVLLPRIWNFGLGHRIEGQRCALPGLYGLLTRAAASLARRPSQRWVASPVRKLKNGLHGALAEAGARLAVIQTTRGGWDDYRHLLRELGSSGVKVFRVSPFAAHDVRVRRNMEALQTIGGLLRDTRVRLAWTLYQPYFMRNLPKMLALADEGGRLMRALDARMACTYEANSWTSAALMDAASQAGAARVVFNHNSHPPSSSAIAQSVLETLFQQRTCNAMTDVAMLWSPTSLQRASAAAGRVLPVSLAYPPSPSDTREPGRPLRVLHAGNYQNWSDFFPWVAETADEYVDGLEKLAAVVEQLDGIQLVIRVRPKREVDSRVVDARLGNRRNVTVCGTDQDFLEQLAESDLLIAHFSTTVEQALQMGKPVLLWGSAGRYIQFEPRPPVHAARDTAELATVLAALRDAYCSAPPDRDATMAYRFPPGTRDLAAAALELVRSSTVNQAEVACI
jgi:hypothetical protein